MNEHSKNNEPTPPADKLVTLTEEELAGVSGGDVKPTEQISLAFNKIEFKYH